MMKKKYCYIFVIDEDTEVRIFDYTLQDAIQCFKIIFGEFLFSQVQSIL